MTTPKDPEAGRNLGGRPRLYEGEETVPVSIKMTIPQRDKLKRLGGPQWVRDRIDKASEPSKK